MKSIYFVLTILMIFAFSPETMASSCSTADASCPSGTCGVTETSEKVQDDHAGHAHAKEAKHEEHKEKHSAATLNTPALKTLMDSGMDMIILDARSGKFDDGMRIPGAKSLNAESSPEEIAKIVPDKDKLVVTYCANLQCPASDMLYKHLKSLGYSNVIEYPEGIQGWKEAGHQVKPAK
jgi:rhodanese-related sulfurtransferase